MIFPQKPGPRTNEPAFAYQAAKLFDSQPDMAWSTDGQKTNGPGEKLTITFESEQEIHGLMLWNGYQRSDVHYRANGRVKTLRLNGQNLKIQDIQGPQTVTLPKPFKSAEAVLEIADIYPGGSYKDVLISELRFLGPDDTILLPMVTPAAPTPPPALTEFLDRTFMPILHESAAANPVEMECMEECVLYRSELRLRSNGSFVIYSGSVIEGNWEALPDGGLRLFGKTYYPNTGVNFSSYLKDDSAEQEESGPPPRIFQSLMEAKRFSAFSRAEQENAVRFMLQRNRNTYYDENQVNDLAPDSPWAIYLKKEGEFVYIGGPDLDTAVKNIVAKLNEIDPFYVKSDIYTDILLPRYAQYSPL